MDETGSKNCEENTGEKLQEEAVEPHVEAEQEVTSVKVCNLMRERTFLP